MRHFIGFLVLVVAFAIGTLAFYFTDYIRSATPTGSAVNPVDLEVSLPASICPPGPSAGEPGNFTYPDPTYKFPQSGLYFIWPMTESGSDFSFELTYETYDTYPTIRGVTKKRLESVREAWVFDGETEYLKTPVKVAGQNISFRTRKIGGIEYVFEGIFTKEQYLESTFDKQIVLRGVVQKLSRGRQVYQAEVKFTYTPGC